jgi:hypothetical protein
LARCTASRFGRFSTAVLNLPPSSELFFFRGNHELSDSRWMAPARSHPAFSEDEYQACSGIGHDADKKTVVEWKDPTGRKPTFILRSFVARLKPCPVTKPQRIHYILYFVRLPEQARYSFFGR